MGNLSTVWRIATRWYISLPFVVALGIILGYFVFFESWPSKPKIGVIDIPFTVITDDSAFVINAFLNYARERDDIKAVVIKLNSPGSFGAAGERVYGETSKLREEKPVVTAMKDLVASGAYMWSLGANYTYATPGSWVGSVGVIIAPLPPLVPPTPDEQVIATGPVKGTFGSRRDLVRMLDQLKENFYQMVVAERGDKLRISREELLHGRVYNGNEALRLGLVDALGGDTEAIEKAASLADISSYDLVDINTEVFREFNEKFWRIIEPLEPLLAVGGDQSGLAEIRSLMALSGGTGDSADPLSVTSVDMLRRLYLPSGISETQNVLSDFSLEINTPRIYYLYVGPSE